MATKLSPGDVIEILGVCFEDETGEMEVYPSPRLERGEWWGVKMTKKRYETLAKELRTTGSFKLKGVRHELISDEDLNKILEEAEPLDPDLLRKR